jgi:hypothetical protein
VHAAICRQSFFLAVAFQGSRLSSGAQRALVAMDLERLWSSPCATTLLILHLLVKPNRLGNNDSLRSTLFLCSAWSVVIYDNLDGSHEESECPAALLACACSPPTEP